MELYQIKEERKCQCQIHVSQYLKKLTSRRTLFKSLKNQALTFKFFCAKSESFTSFVLFKLWRTIFSYSRIPCKITNWRSYKINAQASETLIDIWFISISINPASQYVLINSSAYMPQAFALATFLVTLMISDVLTG